MTTLELSEKMEGAVPSGEDVEADGDGSRAQVWKDQLSHEQRGDHVVLKVKALKALCHSYGSVCSKECFPIFWAGRVTETRITYPRVDKQAPMPSGCLRTT